MKLTPGSLEPGLGNSISFGDCKGREVRFSGASRSSSDSRVKVSAFMRQKSHFRF